MSRRIGLTLALAGAVVAAFIVAFALLAVFGKAPILGFIARVTGRRAPAAILRPAGPALVRPASTVYEEWRAQWQSALPVTSTLRQGSTTSFFGTSTSTHRTYTLHVEVQNKTGRPLDTGTSLYLVETSLKPAAEKPKESALVVAGGYFRKPPLQDYSGVAEYRNKQVGRHVGLGESEAMSRMLGEEREREDPEGELLGMFNSQSRSPSGGVFRRLGPILQFSVGGSPDPASFSFGKAGVGEKLVIDSELELAVMVADGRLDRVVLLSPTLVVKDDKGQAASFRYVLTFESVAKEGRKPEEKEWALAETRLLPLTGEALLPMASEKDGPLWRRVFASRWVGEHGAEPAASALGAIVSGKGSENDALRASALLGLGSGKHASAIQTILDVAGDPSEGDATRGAAILALGSLGDARATPVLLTIASGKDEAEAKQAIDSLGRIGDRAAVEPLLKFLESGRKELHSEAGDALARLADNSSLERLARIAARGGAAGATAAVRAIGGVGSAEAVAALLGLLPTASVDRRKEICQGLGSIDRPEAVAALKGALQDKNKDVRQAALEGIAARGGAGRAEALREALHHSDVEIQKRAARALGEAGIAEAKAEVAAIVEDAGADPGLREAATEALRGFPGTATEQLLVRTAADPKPEVRVAALGALRELKAKAGVPAMTQALKDADAKVRAAAAEALGKMGDRGVSSALLDAVLAEKDSSPLGSAVDALIALEYKDLSAFPRILSRLRDVDQQGRFPIGRLLKHISGQDFSPEYGAPPKQVEASIAKWQGWWEKSPRAQ